jgi:DNA polymerase III epsilon subunit-like protein
VFFHNAPFDAGFLKTASNKTRLKFTNQVHDTLPMARQAWPSLGTYKLAVLAEHIGAPAPTHRGLTDVKATLAVLLAARQKQG